MKRLKDCRMLVTGIMIGVTLSLATTAFATGVIKKAEYNGNKVIFNGYELTLSSPLVSIVDEATPQNSSNYMPVRAVLEAMDYDVVVVLSLCLHTLGAFLTTFYISEFFIIQV